MPVEVTALEKMGREATPKEHETFRQHVVDAVAEFENGDNLQLGIAVAHNTGL
jgi:hypothetical protein